MPLEFARLPSSQSKFEARPIITDPKPFAWTADPDAIAEKFRRGYHASVGRQTG